MIVKYTSQHKLQAQKLLAGREMYLPGFLCYAGDERRPERIAAYVQENAAGRVSALIFCFSGTGELLCTEDADLAEIALFYAMMPLDTLNGEYHTIAAIAEIQGQPVKPFDILVWDEQAPPALPAQTVLASSLSDAARVHILLEKCRSDTFRVAPYSSYYLEMFWRYQDGSGITYHIEQDLLPVCTASVRYLSARYGLLCNVATSPDYRGRGLARACVSHAARYVLEKGKIPLIQARIDSARRLYRSLGFRRTYPGGQLSKEEA